MLLFNGAFWSAGNGLTSGAVIYYLAFKLGATGSDIGWILAAPALVGLLRMFSPQLIRFFGSARRTCLLAWGVSYAIVWGIPLLAMPAMQLSNGTTGVSALIVVLALHQLMEYVGVVGFWAWAADLVPSRVRGRFFARRVRWQIAALAPTLLLSGWFVDAWQQHLTAGSSSNAAWAYVIATSIGAVLLLVSLIPLIKIRISSHAKRASTESAKLTLQSQSVVGEPQPRRKVPSMGYSTAPFRDSRFLRLLAYGCFVAIANGITQSAQNYANKAYGISLGTLAAMRISMLLGQFGVSGPLGKLSDRLGNRPALILCQAVVALGPMFYLLASPEHPWWIWGAWIAWAAFAGLNIGLPNLMLKLGGESKAAYIATYFAISGLIYAIATIAGGYVFDELREQEAWTFGRYLMPAERVLFFCGWVLRSAGVVFLIVLIEPGAVRWKDWLSRRFGRNAPKAPIPS